jgi:hypothetical protein
MSALRYQLRASATAAVALAVLAAGCGHVLPATRAGATSGVAASLSPSPYPAVSSPAAAPALPVPPASTVNGTDANAVAQAGVQALEQFDTAVDADPNSTAARAAAAGWLTPGFASQVRDYPPVAAPGAQWTEWASHRAYVRVTTSLGGDEHPPDSATTARRQVTAQLTPVGRDGWTGPTKQAISFVTLSLIDGQWRLAGAQTS